ncbi:MAG: hypothetical protein IJU92_07810 [Spirochaetaceae bacterium]|nr:hypothetical protein [Spirochaetaceae bacterium]
MKKCFISLCFSFAVFFAATANEAAYKETVKENLTSILSPSIVGELLKDIDEQGNASVTRLSYTKKKKEPSLKPESSLVEKTLSYWTQDNPIFMLETLYVYKKSENRSGTVDIQRISDVLHAVSTLQGIQYYSSSRKTMRTLYEVSSAVKPVMQGKKQTYEKIPDDLQASEQLVLQKDLTFGEYIYKYSYIRDKNGIGCVCENTQALKYGIFSLVKPYNMNICLTVFDFGDFMLAYALTRGNFPKIIGLDSKLKDSFSTRTDAIYNWFIKNYEER